MRMIRDQASAIVEARDKYLKTIKHIEMAIQIEAVKYNQTVKIIKYIETVKFFSPRSSTSVFTLMIKGMVDNARQRLAI